jgi:hypothetical protein
LIPIYLTFPSWRNLSNAGSASLIIWDKSFANSKS